MVNIKLDISKDKPMDIVYELRIIAGLIMGGTMSGEGWTYTDTEFLKWCEENDSLKNRNPK